MSPPKFLTSDVLPLRARLRAAAEPFTRRSDGTDESIAQFARRHLGRRATAVLADAMQTGIFAGDVEKLSLRACFPRLAEMERDHRSLVLALVRERRRLHFQSGSGSPGSLTSFDGGMQTLVDALAAALGDRLRLGAEVRGLRRDRERWIVQLGGPRASELAADAMVLAAPSSVSASLLRPVDAEAADLLRSIHYAPLTVVHLAFRRLARAPRGFGFLVPAEEKRRVLGAMFIHSFFPWRVPAGGALVTVMMGGARQPELAALDDAEICRVARDELAAMVGLETDPSFVEIVRWPSGIPQYELGHLARMERIDQRVRALPGLHLVGHAYRGVGVNECLRQALRVAEAVAASG